MEKMNLKTVDAHIGALKSAVDHIAYVRRIAETCDIDMEEFDSKLNALCDKCAKKYANMNEMQLAIHGLMEIVKGVDSEDAVQKIFSEEN